ncbi:MAG: PGRS family protein [Polyangiaceae bacterium]|nr:PGRS family protein [Polyangiaceae bacterium]
MHLQRKGLVTLVALAGVISAPVGGCFPFEFLDDCERLLACSGSATLGAGGSGGGGGVNPACVPSASSAPVGDSCGVFVSLSGDDGAKGTQASPVKSLAKAIELAQGAGKPVYACAEAFSEAVEVPAGVTIFGGLACDDGWSYVGEKTKTTIAGGADEIAMRLLGGDGTTRLEDVKVIAADAMALGGSSIAVLADGAAAEFARCEFVAGAGRDGENGQTPSEAVGPSDPNDPAIKGAAGAAACMGAGSGNPGGFGAINALCNTSSGGDGGKGLESAGGNGDDGLPIPDPNPTNKGLGGAGDTGSGCEPGAQGANGAQGMGGTGAADLGTIDSNGYAGPSGGDGLPGGLAQGGGGGGGAKGKVGCNGASGGGGGAGGCAGKGGTGGTAAGSSIALISLNANLLHTDVVLRTAAGGKGGDGGDGQGGGVGGNGGDGGLGDMSAPATFQACNGGKGGQGGSGGKGGGGRGGHSIGIAYTGDTPSTNGVTFEIGAAGIGGIGADATGNGADGVAEKIQGFM